MFERFNKFSDKQKTLIALGIFALLIAVFYGNTLLNGFVLDEIPVILENYYIQDIRYLPKVITGCIWEVDLGSCEGNAIHYRPVQSLSYLLSWQVTSQPWFFHLVNLFYFFVAAFLVFVFVKLLTKKFLLALFTTTLFIVHPINSEVVNWISLVPDVTLLIFTLLALIFYLKYREGNSARNLFFIYLFYFFALLSKETAVFAAPLLILALDFLVFRIPVKRLLRWHEIKKYLLFGIPLVIYVLMRLAVFGSLGRLASGGGSLSGYSPGERIYVFFTLFVQYLRELVYPLPLIAFHEFTLSSNILSAPFLLSFLGIVGLIALFFWAFYKKKDIIVFAFAVIAIFSIPTLIFFNFSGTDVFFHRFLFGATIGLALLVAYFLNALWEPKEFLHKKKLRALQTFYPFKHLAPVLIFVRSPRNRRAFVLVFLSIIVVLSFSVIYPGNRVWKDNETVVRENVDLNPDAHYANSMREFMAKLHLRQDDLEGAVVWYQEIIDQNIPGYGLSSAYNNLAEYERQQGNFDQAEAYYYQAIESSEGTNYKAYNNLGAFYIEQQDYLLAVANFCRALFVDPQAPEPQFNINRVGSLIQESDEETITKLYTDITEGDIMQHSEQEIIRYNERSCEDDNCLFLFSSRFIGNEIILPFLILASTKSDTFRVENSSFNPQTGDIVLETPKTYQYSDVSFIFPTCQGVYYEAIAR